MIYHAFLRPRRGRVSPGTDFSSYIFDARKTREKSRIFHFKAENQLHTYTQRTPRIYRENDYCRPTTVCKQSTSPRRRAGGVMFGAPCTEEATGSYVNNITVTRVCVSVRILLPAISD